MYASPSTRFRRILLLLLAATLLPAAGCRPSAGRAPNIILVMVDTLRADYLGTYGFEGEVSPNLDRLAAESVVFRSCFSQSPWTKPAVASLFTSLYPQVHGLTNHEGKYWGDDAPGTRTGILADRATTLAESLRAGGYETAGFVSNPWVGAAYGFAQGFDLYEDKFQNWMTSVVDITQAARSWLASRDSSSPYFLYLHFMDVHAPYSAPQDDFAALRQSPSVASARKLRANEMPDALWQNIEIRPEWASDEIRSGVSYWRARYASGVRAFDRTLGQFVEHLRDNGELDRSLFVFTSDHGEELFEHRNWSHGQNLYDHQLHVPLIVRKPQGEDGGLESESLVELVDLMPTLLQEVGVDPPPGMQGRDVSAALSGRRYQSPGITFATATQKRPGLYSARTADHKLIVDLDSTWERLFELKQDPVELQNTASLKPHVADELRARLLAHISESVAGGILESDSKTLSPEEQERLKALGYLQ
jgi:arylsulfatase A-like enzyme